MNNFDKMEEERIENDDASCVALSSLQVKDLNFTGLDSGFASGGSSASCYTLTLPSSSSINQSHNLSSTKSDLYTSQGPVNPALHRNYERTDSGVCEKMCLMDISDRTHISPLPLLSSISPSDVEKFYNVDADGDCQLHLAIADGASQIVTALIRIAPDPTFLDIQNNEMYAPLHIAVLVNQAAMVRKLVIAGAATDIRDQEGNTPLHLAAKRGHLGCAKELLRSISTEELKDSPMMANSHQHSPSSLLNLKNYNGEHCIHLATFGQHYELIWLLRNQQADMSSLEGRSGKTALHYAVNMGDERLVRLLALPKDMDGCGVWLNARDWSGRTALQCATINGDENIANLLKSLPGCDINIDDSSDEDFEFDTEEDEEIICEFNDIEVNGVRIVDSRA